MRAFGLLLGLSLAGYAVAPPSPLRVLRTTPGDPADPTAVVSVTFDRPVAGQLDGTVDPRTLFAIRPAVPGRVEWQDPITLRFTSALPLRPNTSYTVTVANTFQAMDGSRLEAPYAFTFRVSGPRVLTGRPAGPGQQPRYLRPDAVFELVLSSPVGLEAVSRVVSLELGNSCGTSPVVRLRAVSERAVSDSDPWTYREAGGWDRNRAADSLRRVVRLVPEGALPLACAGWLVTPQTIDSTDTAPANQWPFSTYGPFHLSHVACDGRPPCPTGYARIEFSTPVRGADVLRGVRFAPATPFTIGDTADESSGWFLQASLTPRTTYTVTVDPSLRDVFGQSFMGPATATLATTGYAPALRAVGVTGGFTVAVWVGNFDGRPMNAVSGVTGAGPLLHRVAMDVARRYEPGVLPSPAAFGATRVAVCRLSGLLATPRCEAIAEWFLPGTAPTARDDWQPAPGVVRWPAACAAWAEAHGRADRARTPRRSAPADRFAITSPMDGDRYAIPPGIDPHYATIPLRATGAGRDGPVRWWIDGRPTRATRWRLESGAHVIRAVGASGRTATVRIEVR
jgi:Penicillin-Binding Protein C-terminus Family/Bacterial Ig-like domain